MGDGSVRYISFTVDHQVFAVIGDRSEGQVVELP